MTTIRLKCENCKKEFELSSEAIFCPFCASKSVIANTADELEEYKEIGQLLREIKRLYDGGAPAHEIIENANRIFNIDPDNEACMELLIEQETKKLVKGQNKVYGLDLTNGKVFYEEIEKGTTGARPNHSAVKPIIVFSKKRYVEWYADIYNNEVLKPFQSILTYSASESVKKKLRIFKGLSRKKGMALCAALVHQIKRSKTKLRKLEQKKMGRNLMNYSLPFILILSLVLFFVIRWEYVLGGGILFIIVLLFSSIIDDKVSSLYEEIVRENGGVFADFSVIE